MTCFPDVAFACRDVASHQVKGLHILHTEDLQVAGSRVMTNDDDDDDVPSVKHFTWSFGWSSIQGKVQRFQPGRAIRTKGAEMRWPMCVCV